MAKDLFTLRTEAFTKFLRAGKEVLEPSELEMYEKKLQIAADYKREEDLDPERLMAKIKMQGILATAEHQRKMADSAVEMREEGRAVLEQSEDYDERKNMWIKRRDDLQPGQRVGFFGIKKFDKEELLRIAKTRIDTVNLELAQLKAEEEYYGYEGDKNTRRKALKDEVQDLKNDLLNNSWVQGKISKKGDSQDKNLFKSYLNSITVADTYLTKTEDLTGTRPNKKEKYGY